MKRFLSIILLISISSQLLCNCVIFIGYELNKKYITEKFCENKNKPSLHCNGKCHLKSQLAKQNQDQKNNTAMPKEIFEFLYCNALSETIFENSSFNLKLFSYFPIGKIILVKNEVFHPPLC